MSRDEVGLRGDCKPREKRQIFAKRGALMTDRKHVSPQAGPGGIASAPKGDAMVESFLSEAKRLGPVGADARPRLIFALDATMSRQPTWDLACRVQGEMFAAADTVGGLSVQLIYFRGFEECRSSRWVIAGRALTDLMGRIDCRGGHTQIARVLRHARNEAAQGPIRALVYVGDAMEEPMDELCALAGELGLLGIKTFMFHEGHDPSAARAFQEMARLSGGVYARFDAAAPRSLAELLRAAATYASGGVDGLRRLADRDAAARGLLASLNAPR